MKQRRQFTRQEEFVLIHSFRQLDSMEDIMDHYLANTTPLSEVKKQFYVHCLETADGLLKGIHAILYVPPK